MKRKSNILLLILIVSSLCLILFPKSVIGSIADINYTFENDIAYSNNNIDFTNSFNLRNKTTYTETYEASYSFTNETDGTSGTDIDFIDFIDLSGNSYIQINNSQISHDKVIEFYDGSANADSGYNEFSDQTIETIEFWWMTNDSTKRMDVYIGDGATIGIYLAFSTNDFYYNDGGFHIIQGGVSNIWYHHRIDFDTTTDTFDWYINGILYSGLGFANALTKVNRLTIFYHTAFTDFSHFFDAFGYSWLTNYSISQNIIPTFETDTSIKEINAYEFGWIAQNQLYAIGWNSDIESWQVDETGGGTAEVYYDFSQVYTDRTVELKTTNSNNVQLEKLDIINPTSNFVNITVGFNISTYDTNGNNFVIQIIDDSTGFAFIEVKVKREAGILNLYYAGSGVGDVLIHGGLNIDDYYEINIFINHEINRANYILYENSVNIEFIENVIFKLIVFPYLVSGISFTCIAPAGGILNVEIDYCGIFDNGESHIPYPDSYGYLTIPLFKNVNIQHNNLITINGTGVIALDSFSGYTPLTPYRTGVNYSVLTTFKNYASNPRISNAYERTSTYDYTTLVFTFSGNNLNLNSIDIEGNKLTEGTNEYFPIYTRGNQTLLDESYFYVDSNNKLQFTLKTSLTTTEYIQAEFDISNEGTTDRAISFRGSKIDLAFGYFGVDYLVGITTIDIPIFEKTTRAILPTNKTIDKFIILITDNDIDTIIGTTTGYISQPKLLAISGIGLPIITAGLLEMMIPLIMIMIPTLLISQGFGKEGKKLIIPLFFIFSLIITATLIIPIWIFFIILFGTALFLARNKEIEVK